MGTFAQSNRMISRWVPLGAPTCRNLQLAVQPTILRTHLLRSQIEKDKFTLFHILMQVPMTVVKHLARSAKVGYEKMRSQLSTDAADSADVASDTAAEQGEDAEDGLLDAAGSVDEVGPGIWTFASSRQCATLTTPYDFVLACLTGGLYIGGTCSRLERR